MGIDENIEKSSVSQGLSCLSKRNNLGSHVVSRLVPTVAKCLAFGQVSELAFGL